MELRVNGITIGADALARETALQANAPDPQGAARRTLAIRELLLERAGALGLLEGGRSRGSVTFADRNAEDAVIAQVLEREVTTPVPATEECRAFFDAHPERFTSGELVEACHILFAVTPGTPVSALRAHAERALLELTEHPARFPARAQELSNCPSGRQGGALGQFGRGTMVPEFDRAVFETRATGVLPGLVATRHGFHIVNVERRIPGRPLPFDHVQARIADYLAARSQEGALRDYLQGLARQASLEGVALFAVAEAADEPA